MVNRIAGGLFVLAACILGSVVGAHAQDVEVGVIRNASGTVSIVRDGTEIPAAIGESVLHNDVIETGPDGTVGIVLADTSQISLGPMTEFHLEEFEFEPLQQQYSFLARIIQGSLVYISGDIGRLSPDDVRIEIPWGAIGLRGTRIAVSATPPGQP